MKKCVSIVTRNENIIEIQKDFPSNTITLGLKDEDGLFKDVDILKEVELEAIVKKFIEVLNELN